jgi:hypothetical protein
MFAIAWFAFKIIELTVRLLILMIVLCIYPPIALVCVAKGTRVPRFPRIL